MVRTRFAPSPTGFLHIGGARTCLFSWLYTRKNNGRFVLRIEDTDRARSKQEYLEEILKSLSWMGVDWDELYYQSKRFDLYNSHAQRLIEQDKAYKKDGAVFFKYNFSSVEINDLIRGRIVFKELPKEEEVIIKSDGSPTYNFSCVIDDGLMEITHVIRGEDHISNTPKQILMYKALDLPVPEFAHVPLIMSEEGGRMSKRYGATAISEYKQRGFLPGALVNYLLLLGWSMDNNREIFSLEQAVDQFDIRDVNKTAAAFSMDKLKWLNSEHIKAKTNEEFVRAAWEFAEENCPLYCENTDRDYFSRAVSLFQTRVCSLSELIEWSSFFFIDNFPYAEETLPVLGRDLSGEIAELIKGLSNLDPFGLEEVEGRFRSIAAELNLKARDLVHPVRCALTGRKVGPGLFETMEVLGKDRVIARLKRLLDYWEKERQNKKTACD